MLKDLLLKNRSYRGYDESRKVTREELADLVDCARIAPSSVNFQPLKYRLVYRPQEVAAVQPLTQWARRLSELHLPHPGHCPTAFIVICQDLTISDSIPRFQKDVGIVAQTMLLRAAELGLGGCMIGSFSAGGVKEALHLPDNLSPQLVVAVGKPQETVVLTEAADGDVAYYRDENDVHYVPKRPLKELLVE